MQANVRKTKLCELGDATLLWVNEGDFWLASVADMSALREDLPPEPKNVLQLVRVPLGKAIMFCDIDHPQLSGGTVAAQTETLPSSPPARGKP